VAAADTRCRPLRAADTAAVLALLRRHPVRNVLLEYLVRSGALGRVPGFYGCEGERGLDAVLLIGVLGSAFMDACSADALRGLGRLAGTLVVQPRHITAPETLLDGFWDGYAPFAGVVQWSRREPLYQLARGKLAPHERLGIRRADESELDEIVANSALQHVEDLKEDRAAYDPEGFRHRHQLDLRAGHWWVVRRSRHIVFQVHVGPENEDVLQLGGVFTHPEQRQRGYATRAISSLCAQLLERKAAVCLFCDEANTGARRVYERIGFEVIDHFRSVLLAR
jgi:RimJ/RimL family protein N-acetyltransferase